MPNTLGVSMPKGMAVTSFFPVALANRKAIQKNIKSPTITPRAVPGIIFWMMNFSTWPFSAAFPATPHTPGSRATTNSKLAMLSNISPKNAFTSPGAAHRYRFIASSASIGLSTLEECKLSGR